MDFAVKPSASSLALRASLHNIVSGLRRTRPRVPFFRLAAHRVPTLRLYKDLLRLSPTSCIRLRVSELFRANKHHTDTNGSIAALRVGYKWLDVFSASTAGDEGCRALLTRYDRFLGLRKQKQEWAERLQREAAWQARLRSRPILTGKWLWATNAHRPMPRLKPQPIHMTMIIKKRRRAYTRRQQGSIRNKELRQSLREEAVFEDQLFKDPRKQLFSTKHLSDWNKHLAEERRTLLSYRDKSNSFAQSPFPEEMLRSLRAARRDKIVNKTRERMRELRGEVTKSKIRRMMQGPPAHVLSHMTAEQIEEDKAMRSLSTVGYIGLLKEKNGRSGINKGDGWDVGLGQWITPEQNEKMDAILEDIHRENDRRRSTES